MHSTQSRSETSITQGKKRQNEADSQPETATKKARPATTSLSQSTLTAFAEASPNLITSRKIQDRKSIFLAHAVEIKSETELNRNTLFITSLPATQQATHNIRAWRFLALKPGRTGLSGPDDFRLVSGYDDDGEKWAGGKLLKLLERCEVVDVLVVVTRWYGGEMLGPIRFKHMEDVSLDVLSKGGWVKPVAPADSHEGSFSQSTDMTVEKAERLLRAKDRTIEELRLQISRFQDSAASPSPTNSSAPSYDNLTIDKAKRLLKARDSTIAALRSKFQQQQTNSASG